MKLNLFRLFVAGAVVLAIASVVNAQQFQFGDNNSTVQVPDSMALSIMSANVAPAANTAAQQAANAGPGALQTYTRTYHASKDGNNYTITVVGRDPNLRGKIPTTTEADVIPVVLTFASDSSVFDPRVPNACSFGHAPDEATLNSPLLQPNPAGFISNGVNVGMTQYIDAFQRAEYHTLVDGSNYHTYLAGAEPGTLFVTAGTAVGFTRNIGCTGKVGFIELNSWDAFVQGTLIPFIQANFGVNQTKFPILLLENVFWYIGNPNNCCVLGYHNANGQSPQETYSPMTFDTSGIFGSASQDTAVGAHEIGEWANDPFVNNPTPAWGGIGQVGGCQGNFEVGDPLTGTQIAPVPMPNGFLYHLQELVFQSWYYNSQFDPSLGTGGKFSFGGTFGGPSKVCPPGGTF